MLAHLLRKKDQDQGLDLDLLETSKENIIQMKVNKILN